MLHEATARNNPAFLKNAVGAGVAAPVVSAAVWHRLPKLCAAVGLKQLLYSELL